MQKRLQNQLHVACPLGTLKNTIFDVKTSPRWTPKISVFFQKSSKNATYHGLWSKMPLGSLQEPAKSLPGASQNPFQGPSRGTQVPSRRSLQPPKRRLRGAQKAKRPVLELDPRRKEMSPVDQSIIGKIDR